MTQSQRKMPTFTSKDFTEIVLHGSIATNNLKSFAGKSKFLNLWDDWNDQ